MIWNLFQKWIGIRVHNNQLKKKRSKGTQSYTWVPLFEMKHNYAADITIGLKNTNFIDSKNVSLNFVWQLQRKRLHSLQARVAILVFWSAKSHQFWRGLWDIASTDIVAKKSKMSVNQSPGGYLGFLIRFGRKKRIRRRHWDRDFRQVSLNYVQWVQKELKHSQPIRRQGSHLGFPICRNKTWKKRFRSCFLSCFVEFLSAVAEKKKQDLHKPCKIRPTDEFKWEL